MRSAIARPPATLIYVVTALLGAFQISADAATHMTLEVDATDAPRGLLSAELEIPVGPGPVDLYFVEWTPGNHNPSGPIQNLVDFSITDSQGHRIHWDRDPAHVHRVTANVPTGVEELRVSLRYICNQPSVISRSTDSYGHRNYAALNWNTVLVYPGDTDKGDLMVSASIRTPKDWRVAAPLPVDRDQTRVGVTSFAPVNLAQLIDSPVVLGSLLKTHTLAVTPDEPHVVDSVGPRPELVELPAARLEKYAEVVRQTQHVFGEFPRDQYRFQFFVDDRLPSFGVEHHECTFISFTEDEILHCEAEGGDPHTVVPHEYIHVWNGKLRTPAGLLARDFHTPAITDLLWVYEGLTTYYTDVIAIRAGLLTREQFDHRLANRIERYQQQAGRQWRSVEDTARAQRFLRDGSPRWGDLRRRQDYYSEGALVWMEADAIIRRGTSGAKSLDDFCRAFFDVQAGEYGDPVEYTRDEVIEGLNEIYAGHDWDSFFHERIEKPVDDLRIDVAEHLGYRLEYVDEPTRLQEDDLESTNGVRLRTSLGFDADEDGKITSIVPGSLADRAGLDYGVRIVFVGDRLFSDSALERAVADGDVLLGVTFDEETIERIGMPYLDGMRFPRLERQDDAPDLIADIVRPLR